VFGVVNHSTLNQFLAVFAHLQNAQVSFVMSVLSTVRSGRKTGLATKCYIGSLF
jgi:hypothetical protein